MAVKRDYYDVLGIDRNADEKTIKKVLEECYKTHQIVGVMKENNQ